MFIVTLFGGAIIILNIENTPNTNIHTFLDAIWYVMATMSTVGYGDMVPISNMGKLVGMALMGVGICIYSLLTAGLSSWLVSRHEVKKNELKEDIEFLKGSINGLHVKIDELKNLLKK